MACLASTSLGAEERSVFLIASEPSDDSSFSFPTLLYRVEGGSLEKVRTVTTQRQNTMFVDVYPARGYAVIGSDRTVGLGSLLLDVIDMSSVSAQTSYDMDICDGCGAISSHLQDRSDTLAYFLEGYNDGSVYKGIDLTTGRKLTGFDRTDEANTYRTGYGSIFADGSRPFRAVVHDGNQLIYGEGDTPRRVSLGWQEPRGYGWAPGSVIVSVYVNNDELRIISVDRHSNWEGEVRGLGLHAYDKVAREWSRIDIPAWYAPFRAFGHWLVSQETDRYEPGSLNLARLELQCFPPFLSAAVNLSMDRGIAPTGRLLFYNALTKTYIVHETDEPNSEVLYVDKDDTAWFRVSNELRRAPIQEGRLGPPEVVAKGPELWAVHWLFFGKQ